MTGRSSHGGNLRALARASGRAEDDVLDFSANLNPLGLPEWLRPLIASQVSRLVHYPDPDETELREAVAQRYGVGFDEVITGNGSTEIISLLPDVLSAECAVVLTPCYSDYARAASLAGMQIQEVGLREEDGFRPDAERLAAQLTRSPRALVFLGQPNNPTGLCWEADALRRLSRRFPETTWVVDEAFGDFVEGFDSLTRDRPANMVVLLSLTKIFAIPGLRLGCAVASQETTAAFRRRRAPWSVNTFAQAAGVAAVRDSEYLQATRAYVGRARNALVERLSAIDGLHVYPGSANFLLVRLPNGAFGAEELNGRLLKRGMAIRVCSNFAGLDDRFFRVAVRREEENRRLATALEAERSGKKVAHPAKRVRRTPAIMFQGTSSNAGKSILTAALCRILLQDGRRVAPFKAQNMSLNSFVTRDGGEMGRAQVLQAQACRIEPDVRMNPILLKPNSDTGSQVIVRGKPVGNMRVGEYFRYKPTAFETVKQSYEELAAEYDVLVIEGAGSPGEVNLKRHDIVNMSMARYAEAPVLLVGDIDRGGVYASFIGTMEVLAEWERALVAGFVVNRFRGQESLLADAHEYTQRHTGRPVLGVVPYLRDLGLPEEDSVSFKEGKYADSGRTTAETLFIAVVDLPHIANFTDFDALRLEPDVRVRIARRPEDLGQETPDLLILPGSKNVVRDFHHLRETGWDAAVRDLASGGHTEIVGVCGGFQMLGDRIEDPHRIESSRGDACTALGLLPLTTVLEAEKTLTRSEATHLPSGQRLHGYEIHHGRTPVDGLEPIVRRDDGEIIGAGRVAQRVWGTYLHGLFDADEFRRRFLDGLRERRGWAPLKQICARYDLDPALDRLADVVRRGLKMDPIYRLLER